MLKDHCSLLSLVIPTLLFTLAFGCSQSPCYKGYVPVTEKEALAFGQELVDRAARGDDSWYVVPPSTWRTPERINANAAVFYFYGLDIPEKKRDPDKMKEESDRIGEDLIAEADARNLEELRLLSDPVLKGVKPTFNTYSVYFEFLYAGKIKTEQHYTVVKNKKTGGIVIAGQGMSLPKPKGK